MRSGVGTASTSTGSLPPPSRPVASNRLRVLIAQEPLAVDPAIEPVAIGELVRPSSGHPVALISIEAAKHLVSSVPGRVGEELAAVDERRLGKVLGRTLAHEIGHYLLDTPTHARSGLMRPNFDAFEFIDLRDGAFALDRAAAAWLRTRDVEKFAYQSSASQLTASRFREQRHVAAAAAIGVAHQTLPARERLRETPQCPTFRTLISAWHIWISIPFSLLNSIRRPAVQEAVSSSSPPRR